MPTQRADADRHAERRGWRVVARFKDDGYSAFKEIQRDDFVNLIEAIERAEIDVVIIRDVDRLMRNLPDWSRFEANPASPTEPPRIPPSRLPGLLSLADRRRRARERSVTRKAHAA